MKWWDENRLNEQQFIWNYTINQKVDMRGREITAKTEVWFAEEYEYHIEYYGMYLSMVWYMLFKHEMHGMDIIIFITIFYYRFQFYDLAGTPSFRFLVVARWRNLASLI